MALEDKQYNRHPEPSSHTFFLGPTCNEEGVGGAGEWACLYSSRFDAAQLGFGGGLSIGETLHRLWGGPGVTLPWWPTNALKPLDPVRGNAEPGAFCASSTYPHSLSYSSAASSRADTRTRSCPECSGSCAHSFRCWYCTRRCLSDKRTWGACSECLYADGLAVSPLWYSIWVTFMQFHIYLSFSLLTLGCIIGQPLRAFENFLNWSSQSEKWSCDFVPLLANILSRAAGYFSGAQEGP